MPCSENIRKYRKLLRGLMHDTEYWVEPVNERAPIESYADLICIPNFVLGHIWRMDPKNRPVSDTDLVQENLEALYHIRSAGY